MTTGYVRSAQFEFDFGSMMNSMMNLIFMVIAMKILLSAVAEPKAPELPPGYAPIPGGRPLTREQIERARRGAARRAPMEERVVGTGMTTTEIESKREALEAKGEQIAVEASEEYPERQLRFMELGGDWATRFGITRYWFEDVEGNRIVATDLEELRWKLGVMGG